jgi:hypothetical protein
MLPATLQFLIVMIASAINDRLQRKLDYVEEERAALEVSGTSSGGRNSARFAVPVCSLGSRGRFVSRIPSARGRCVLPCRVDGWSSMAVARLTGKCWHHPRGGSRGFEEEERYARSCMVESAASEGDGHNGW